MHPTNPALSISTGLVNTFHNFELSYALGFNGRDRAIPQCGFRSYKPPEEKKSEFEYLKHMRRRICFLNEIKGFFTLDLKRMILEAIRLRAWVTIPGMEICTTAITTKRYMDTITLAFSTRLIGLIYRSYQGRLLEYIDVAFSNWIFILLF